MNATTAKDGKVPKPLNVRQEKFAQLVAGGMAAITAYVEAGYSSNGRTAEANASRLLENDGVALRVTELRKKVETVGEARAVMTLGRKLAILEEIIETRPSEVTRESMACAEFTEEVLAEGASRGQLRRGQAPSGNEVAGPPVVRRKIKMVDRLRAIELHSKLAGHFPKDEPELPIEAGVINLQTIQNIVLQIRVTSPLLLHRIGSAGRVAIPN